MELFNDFARVMLSIIFEAVPFVLRGAVISGFMEVMLPADALGRIMPRNPILAALAASVAGFVLPMCECGIVPVLRRLVRKGVPLHAAVAYMLAAPIANPVVIVSTLVAFRLARPLTVAGLRVGLGIAIAVAVAIIVSRVAGAKPLKVEAELPSTHRRPPLRQAVPEALRHAGHDFVEIAAFLVLGSAVAAVLNVYVPRASLIQFAGNHIPATLSMMGLAVALNLCSEADAFVAWSLRDFSVAARLGFLVLGPMLDIKLMMMYTRVFRTRMIVTLVASVLALVFTAIVALGYVWPSLRQVPASPTVATEVSQ